MKKMKKNSKKTHVSGNDKNTNAKNTSKIRPLGDRVALRPLTIAEIEKKSLSGIIIPDSVNAKEKPEQGVVVAIGPGKYDDGRRIPMSVNIGDVVIFSKYGHDEIKIDDEEFYILSESQILGIIG